VHGFSNRHFRKPFDHIKFSSKFDKVQMKFIASFSARMSSHWKGGLFQIATHKKTSHVRIRVKHRRHIGSKSGGGCITPLLR
jgi:hypothetical protein